MNQFLALFSARIRAIVRHSSLKQLSVYGASASLAQLLVMVYAILVARFLGPESYGLFAGNYAMAGLTIFLVNWGMDTWMLREGGIHSNPRMLSSTVLQTKLTMGFLWVLALVALAPVIRPTLFPRVMVLVCALDVLGDSVLVTMVSGLNIQKHSGQASRLLLLTRGSRLVGAVLLIAAGIKAPLVFSGLRLMTTLAVLGWGWLLVSPVWSRKGVEQSICTLRSSLSYGIPELLALVYAQADVTLLGFLSGKVEVGEYSPALSLINALVIVPNSIFYILVPLLSNKFQFQQHQFKKASLQMAGIYGAAGLGMAIAVALVIRPLITFLIGEKYLLTGSLVLILSPILFLKSISYACATYLVVVGWQSRRIGAQLVSALANIGLNLVFIPLYGPLGAAWIYVFSEFVLMVGYLGLALHHHHTMSSPISEALSQ